MSGILKGLTLLIAALAGISTFGGLLIPDLYRDNSFYTAAWRANDAVTALLTPALLVSFHYYRRGKVSAQMVWLGLLLFMFYNYAFYLFGAAFNWFFPIYAALFTLSLYALLLGLREVIGHPVSKLHLRSGPRKFISTFLLLVAFPLAVVELSQWWRFTVSGVPPEIPQLIMALDLTLVIPNTILAVWLLMQKNTWGTVMATMMLVKSFTYGLVLVTSATFIAITDAGPWDPLLPFYIFVSAGGLVFVTILLKDLAPAISKS
jgi:hypothetical protein